MPAGRYVVLGGDGGPVGTEAFRCAPGPMGWRYFSEIETTEHGLHHEVVDIAVDADWRPARVRINTGEHEVLLGPSGSSLVGYLDRRRVELAWGPGWHLDYLTPATNLITTKLLPGTAEIDVVLFEPLSLDPQLVRQRYEFIDDEEVDTRVGRFAATRWRCTSLDGGWTGDLWVAGDVVVSCEGIFELERYEPGANGPVPLA
jgi:hypothetical protein